MDFYIARQPILDTEKKLFAYELLFRDGFNNAFPKIDSNEATQRLIENGEFSSGFKSITANYKAFINFTEHAILKGLPELLPKNDIVIELLETVTPSEAVLAAVKQLKSEGYILALDDFEYYSDWDPFLPFIDIIKLDFRALTEKQIRQQMAYRSSFSGVYLAEKIETYEEFHQARELGFGYFQGYFFARPEVLKRKSLPVSHKIYLELLETLSNPDYDPDYVARLVEHDAGISYKLLRFVNSAFFSRRSQINSLKQAVVRLGQAEIRKFLAIIATASLGEQKPNELLRLLMTRAKFCEQLARSNVRYGADPDTAFLIGLLSKLDALMDDDLPYLLNYIAASDVICKALLEKRGPIAFFIGTSEALEQAHWEAVTNASTKLKLEERKLMQLYHGAANWAINLSS
ncbi:HDOD domain-containing protein [Idiomarina seosinensis]|uniref:EAL and HDOD domain-containing protein n=1 Tax=Idiomarina seosinensis TaxID=281739 RepID=UPI00385014A8